MDSIRKAYIQMLTESISIIHPERDERGRAVTIHTPHKPSLAASWSDPEAHAMITPGHSVLDGNPKFNSDKPDWNDSSLHGDFKEPEINNLSRKPLATGVVIHEDDGRVWVVHPTNQFGGYAATFPKGKVDSGMNPRANAIKEAWEESGLSVKLTGHAADTERSTSYTRYYHAKRIGGSPKHMGWESQAVSLVPKSIIHKIVNHPNDSSVVNAINRNVLTESVEHPMIEVDGEMKHRHNSLGQPIHHTDDGIRNFHRWFKDSNSVDEHGRPKVFYHGTGADIDNFDKSKIGFNNRFGPGFYFTDDKKTFDSYSNSIGGNVLPVYLKTKNTNFDDHLSHEQIDAFHSVLQDKKFPNGYDATKDHETIRDQLKTDTHAFSSLFGKSSLYFSKDDWFRGMKALNIDSIHRKMFGGNEVVVHSPDQIKSALGNDGTFNHPTRITESVDLTHSGLPLTVNNIHDTRKEIIATDTYKLAGKDTGYPIEAGKLILSKIDGDWRGTSLHVTESHRNKGLAFHLLHHAVKEVGPIKTSRVFSPGGLNQMNGLVRRGLADAEENGDFLIHFKPQLKESVEHPMIMVDGEQRHQNNSLGKPIHSTYEGIANFHRWFGKSKAVDEHGRPQVYYHGTGTDFDHFSHKYVGKGIDAHGSGFYFTQIPQLASQYASSHVLPVYLKLTKPIDRTTEKTLTRNHIEKMIRSAPEHIDSLSNFGDPRGNNYNRTLQGAVDAYSDSTKFDAMEMIHHDFYTGEHEKFLNNFKKFTGHDGVLVKSSNIVTVFHPSQIKSAIGNDGTFDHPTKITESVDHPMIDVDGEMKHRNNSLGQPIHHTDDGIRNFHRWFEKSTVVDKHGRPKVVYHGTGSNIHEFDNKLAPAAMDKNREGAMWFSTAPEVAGTFAGSQRGEHFSGITLGHSNILPVYLKIESPVHDPRGKHAFGGGLKREDINDLIDDGHDGVHFPQADADLPDTTEQGPVKGYYRNRHGQAWGESEDGYPDQYATFHPSQIKSAIGNDGTFDHPTKITESYHGEHRSPDPDTGAPAHKLTDNGIYPEDIYSSNAAKLYGDGRDDDASVIAQLTAIKGRPNASIKVYRAIPHEQSNSERIEELESHKRHILRTGKIPTGVAGFTNSRKYYEHAISEIDRLKKLPEKTAEKIKINPGDWVTTNLRYAHEHGRGNLNNKYKVISKTVSASSIYTDGNSIHEFGYHPKNKITEETMNSAIISEATSKDYPDIMKVDKHFPNNNLFSSTESFTKPNHKMFVAKLNDKVVGYLHLNDNHINKMLTLPSLEGRGIGSALLSHALKSTNRNVTLNVRHTNTKAQSLYKKIGFDVLSKTDNYYKNGDSAIHMIFRHNTNITDSVMAAYKQVISEASNDEDLSAIWKKTANQPWHEYMKTVKGLSHDIKQQQGEDSDENDASKKRVADYLTKYKHLF